MTGPVVTVVWTHALLYAAIAFIPIGLLLQLAAWAGSWVGDHLGQAIVARILRHRHRVKERPS